MTTEDTSMLESMRSMVETSVVRVIEKYMNIMMGKTMDVFEEGMKYYSGKISQYDSLMDNTRGNIVHMIDSIMQCVREVQRNVEGIVCRKCREGVVTEDGMRDIRRKLSVLCDDVESIKHAHHHHDDRHNASFIHHLGPSHDDYTRPSYRLDGQYERRGDRILQEAHNDYRFNDDVHNNDDDKNDSGEKKNLKTSNIDKGNKKRESDEDSSESEELPPLSLEEIQRLLQSKK